MHPPAFIGSKVTGTNRRENSTLNENVGWGRLGKSEGGDLLDKAAAEDERRLSEGFVRVLDHDTSSGVISKP